jgi:phospholipid/cholesterol/gamma-HCH transport system substrate-binding protein
MAELEIKPTAAARARVLGTISAAVVIWGVLVFLLTGGGRNLFQDRTIITTFMPDVTNLAVKSDVRLSGISIGRVTKLEITRSLDPQQTVRVEMRVNTGFLRRIPQDSRTSVGEDTPIGYWFVSIAEGRSRVPLARNGTLESAPAEETDSHVDLVQTLENELRKVDNLLVQISSSETPIGRFVLGEREYDDMLARVAGFEKSIRALIGPGSQAGQVLFADTLYNRIREPLLRTDNMLAAIERGEGEIGRLFASDEQYDEMLRGLQDLRAALAAAGAGRGRAGPLLHDDEGYRKLRTILAQTEQMIAALNSGAGGVGHLLANPQLYESLNGSLRDMQELLKDLREHPAKYLRYKVY